MMIFLDGQSCFHPETPRRGENKKRINHKGLKAHKVVLCDL